MESLKVLKAGHWLSQCNFQESSLLPSIRASTFPPPPTQKHKGNLKKKHIHKTHQKGQICRPEEKQKTWFLGPTYKKHHAAGSRQRHLDQLFSNRPAAGF